MSVAATLGHLGGCATAGQLRRRHSKRAIRGAVLSGEILHRARGRYVVAEVAAHRQQAYAACAVLSHVSAALEHGWAVKNVPERAWIVVSPGRSLPNRETFAHVSWAGTSPAERAAGVTAPLRTVIDCCRVLPRDEALAVADSALRARAITRAQLRAAALGARGQGAGTLRWVAAHADARAANPFESVLRAILLTIPGLDLRLQHVIAEPGLFAIVDLADPILRLAIEAEGFEHHGTRGGLVRDARRYSELAIYNWSLVRFVWVDVMFHPDWVRWVVESWLATRSGAPMPVRPHDVPAVRDRQPARAAG